MPLYVSEHTKFMRELLEKNPEWVQDQKKGRAIWWDKSIDMNEQKRFQQAKEANKGYPYDVNFEF